MKEIPYSKVIKIFSAADISAAKAYIGEKGFFGKTEEKIMIKVANSNIEVLAFIKINSKDDLAVFVDNAGIASELFAVIA